MCYQVLRELQPRMLGTCRRRMVNSLQVEDGLEIDLGE